MNTRKIKKIEIIFAITGLTALTVIVLSLIYSLGFLSNSIISAFSPPEDSAQESHFDLEAFNKLNL